MKKELDEIKLSNTMLSKEIGELRIGESQTQEEVQRLKSENEKKDDQILLLQLDVKHLRELEKTYEKQKSQSKLAEKSLKDLS